MIFPDLSLGKQALQDAKIDTFPIGLVGAGSGASAGKMSVVYELITKDDQKHALPEPSGQGGSFGSYDSIEDCKVRIGVFSVLNPVGCIFNREQECVLGHKSQTLPGKRYPTDELVMNRSTTSKRDQQITTTNTTVSILITNVSISDNIKRQIVKQLHSSMSINIQPFNTLDDGDTFFFVSTNELNDDHFNYLQFATLASKLVSEAILSIVSE